MERKYYKIVGLMYGIIGLVVFVLNFITTSTGIDDAGDHVFAWWNWLILFLALLLIILSLSKKNSGVITVFNTSFTFNFEKINKIAQFICPTSFAIITTLSTPKSQWGMQLIFVSALMGLKYRLFGRRGLIILTSIFVIAMQYSSYLVGDPLGGLFALIFSGFCFGSVVILYTNELNRYFKMAIDSKEKLVQIKERMKKYDKNTLNPKDYPFTPREAEILEILCKTHSSNQEIADKLGIKIFTVKSHIKNIFDKAGVDDRHQLIDLFKFSYIED